MRLASRVMAAGARFIMLSPEQTQLKSTKPVLSVTAVRTGCGKSQTTRYLCSMLRRQGIKVAVVRHPMYVYVLIQPETQQCFDGAFSH